MKAAKYWLQNLLRIISVVTLINIIIMYWFPFMIPFSSFVAIRLVVLAFIEKTYRLLLIALLICILLFLTTFSIRRQHIFLPALSLGYLVYDFFIVLSLMTKGMNDGAWKTYIIQAVFLVTLIVLLGMYCWDCWRVKFKRI